MTVVPPQGPPPPLPPFPPAPTNSTLTLPGGGQLIGMVDLPKGMNDDCHVNFNLLLQLGLDLVPILPNLTVPAVRRRYSNQERCWPLLVGQNYSVLPL